MELPRQQNTQCHHSENTNLGIYYDLRVALLPISLQNSLCRGCNVISVTQSKLDYSKSPQRGGCWWCGISATIKLWLQWHHNEHEGVSDHQPTIVYSTVYSGADQRNHQSSAALAFVRGNHRWKANSPHKGPVTWKMFPFDDVIMRFLWPFWINIYYTINTISIVTSDYIIISCASTASLLKKYLYRIGVYSLYNSMLH